MSLDVGSLPPPGTPGQLPPLQPRRDPVAAMLGLGLKTQALFFRQMATMMGSGVTAIHATDTLSKNMSGRFADVVNDLFKLLTEGRPLSEAMGAWPDYFSEFQICMVRAGELGGHLDTRLAEVASFLERAADRQAALITQMIYPLLVLHAAVFLPPLVRLFVSDQGSYLAAVIPGLLLLWGSLAALFFGNRLLINAPALKEGIDAVFYSLPLVGSAMRKGGMAVATRALGDLMEAGVSMSQAIPVAARVTGSTFLGKKLAGMLSPALEGQQLSVAMRQTGLLDPVFLAILTTGEESGTVGQALLKVSEHLEKDYAQTQMRIAVAIPIIVMLFVGALVGYQYIKFFANLYAPLNQL